MTLDGELAAAKPRSGQRPIVDAILSQQPAHIVAELERRAMDYSVSAGQLQRLLGRWGHAVTEAACANWLRRVRARA